MEDDAEMGVVGGWGGRVGVEQDGHWYIQGL